MDQVAKKTILRMFNYNLFAVTSAHGAEMSAMTANWVAQASGPRG